MIAEIDSDSISAIVIVAIVGSRWDRWRSLAKWKPGLRDKRQALKPKTLLLTDGDHLLTREGPEKVGSFYSKTLGKNKHILALLKVCCSSSRCLFTLGRVISLQIKYFAVTKIH